MNPCERAHFTEGYAQLAFSNKRTQTGSNIDACQCLFAPRRSMTVKIVFKALMCFTSTKPCPWTAIVKRNVYKDGCFEIVKTEICCSRDILSNYGELDISGENSFTISISKNSSTPVFKGDFSVTIKFGTPFKRIRVVAINCDHDSKFSNN